MMAALIAPVRLQVFAAMATRTGPGRREQFPPAPNTYSVAYLTPTGAANLTGVSVEDAYAAFRALQKAGLAIPAETNPKRNGFRLDTDNLAAAAGQDPTSWAGDPAGDPV
jgi:predicted acyl esterase